MENKKTITFNIDFDGTCVTNDFPRIGKDIGAARVLRKLVAKGHQLILFTCRSDKDEVESNDPNIIATPGKYLSEAISWFEKNDIPLYGIQSNPGQNKWTASPKSYAEIMIDDTAIGCPLITDKGYAAKPFVDWERVERLLKERNIL